jgi:hypothetical protein
VEQPRPVSGDSPGVPILPLHNIFFFAIRFGPAVECGDRVRLRPRTARADNNGMYSKSEKSRRMPIVFKNC